MFPFAGGCEAKPLLEMVEGLPKDFSQMHHCEAAWPLKRSPAAKRRIASRPSAARNDTMRRQLKLHLPPAKSPYGDLGRGVNSRAPLQSRPCQKRHAGAHGVRPFWGLGGGMAAEAISQRPKGGASPLSAARNDTMRQPKRGLLCGLRRAPRMPPLPVG